MSKVALYSIEVGSNMEGDNVAINIDNRRPFVSKSANLLSYPVLSHEPPWYHSPSHRLPTVEVIMRGRPLGECKKMSEIWIFGIGCAEPYSSMGIAT